MFYRVETEEGLGPYITNNMHINLIDYHFNYSNNFSSSRYLQQHPTPQIDSTIIQTTFLTNKRNNLIFGFNTPKKLIRWFNYKLDQKYFTEYNYKVSIYETPEVFNSKYQSIAYKKDLILKERINFKDFKLKYCVRGAL